MSAIYTFATGMQVQKENVDVHANNIANMETDEFKEMRLICQDLNYSKNNVGSQASANGAINPTGIQIGMGVRSAGTARIMEQGPIQVTNRPLDLMIDGQGFFQIELPDGDTAYTRAGCFVIGPDSYLETIDGLKILPNITIPQGSTDIAINAEGQVFVKIPGQNAPQEIGTIETARFINPSGLEAIGHNLFKETPASGESITGTPGKDGYGSISQGSLEKSNVKPIIEITALMEAQRAYEMNTQGMKKADEMVQSTTQILRG